MTRSIWLLVAIFGTAGILHFLQPRPFIGIVPTWLPAPALLVAISGAAEVAGAIGLLWRRTRSWAAAGLIALLVAVFPANVQMLINAYRTAEPLWWLALLWARLPLQPLLAWLLWRIRRAS